MLYIILNCYKKGKTMDPMSLSDSPPGSLTSPRPIDCSPPASCSSAFYSTEPNLMGSEMLFNINMETMDALLNTAIRAEYNVSADLVRGDDPSPLSPVRDRQLNEMEKAKLQELVFANKALLAPLTEDGPVNVINLIVIRDILLMRFH